MRLFKLMLFKSCLLSFTICLAGNQGWSGNASYSKSEEQSIPSPNGILKIVTEYDYNFKKTVDSNDVIGYARTTQTVESQSTTSRTVTCKIDGKKVQRTETTSKKSVTIMEAESDNAIALFEVLSSMYETEKEVVLTVYALEGKMTIDNETHISGGCKTTEPKITHQELPYSSEKRTLSARAKVVEADDQWWLTGDENGFAFHLIYEQINCQTLEQRVETLQSLLEKLRDSIILEGHSLPIYRNTAHAELTMPPGYGVSFIPTITNEETKWQQTIGQAIINYTDLNTFATVSERYSNSNEIQSISSLSIVSSLLPNGAPAVINYVNKVNGIKSSLSTYQAQFQSYQKAKKNLEECYSNR